MVASGAYGPCPQFTTPRLRLSERILDRWRTTHEPFPQHRVPVAFVGRRDPRRRVNCSSGAAAPVTAATFGRHNPPLLSPAYRWPTCGGCSHGRLGAPVPLGVHRALLSLGPEHNPGPLTARAVVLPIVHEASLETEPAGHTPETTARYVPFMRISLIDRLGIGNAVAVANAGRDATRRRLEDEAIDHLVAALSLHNASLPAEKHGTPEGLPQPSRMAG